MGNWNYTKPGDGVRTRIEPGRYIKQQVNLIARGKNSGITYDLRDAFKELEKKGLLVDVKHDGFTKKDAWNLYLELDKIHKERNLNRDYKHMQKGARFDYSEDEVRRLANAAGYKAVDKVVTDITCPTDHTGVAPKHIDVKN